MDAPVDQCFVGMCFSPLDSATPKIFGFSEFLAGLALMILAWTIADVRYRLRIRSAPIPLQEMTFGVVVAVGVLTLVTDLWRAEEWLVPRGGLLSPAAWQAMLAGVFLLTFLTWTWFAFIRPPTYGKRNAERFAQTLYRFILKGSPSDLTVVADELAYSAKSLVRNATNRGRYERGTRGKNGKERGLEVPKVEAYANDILLLIADKRICRAIVESSPATALAVFVEMGRTKKYGIQVGTFARNVVNEAIRDKDSFLYHEAEGYESGLMGYVKPLSQAMFANYELVNSVGTMLDPDYSKRLAWDSENWEAYCRLVLTTFQDYVNSGGWEHSAVLFRAKDCIEHAADDLYKLDGTANTWDSDSVRRLRVAMDFARDAVKILDGKGVPEHLCLRIRKGSSHHGETIYDHIASLIYELIYSAAAVRSPQLECWTIQHNLVWGQLFGFNHMNGAAGRTIKFKLRRLMYDEIADMKRFPNFKGARILGFCLNVMGLELKQVDHARDSRTLHKAVLAWTRRNYTGLHEHNPRIAENCLVDGIAFEADKLRIVKTHSPGLRRDPVYVLP